MMKRMLACGLGFALLGGAELQERESREAPGPLSRFHTQISGGDNCSSCHSFDGEVDSKRCLACHTEMSRRIGAGKGFHQDKDEFCYACHVEHQGEDAELVEFSPDSFDHGETGFPLLGFHARVDGCRKCHSPSNANPRRSERTYLLRDAGCASCHTDAHGGSFGEDCSACHVFEVSFGETHFDHAATPFALNGAHHRVSCDNCHRLLPSGVKDIQVDEMGRCGMCHRSAHSRRLKSCTQCHNTESWDVSGW